MARRCKVAIEIVLDGEPSDAVSVVDRVLDAGIFQDAINDWEVDGTCPAHVKSATIVAVYVPRSGPRKWGKLRLVKG